MTKEQRLLFAAMEFANVVTTHLKTARAKDNDHEAVRDLHDNYLTLEDAIYDYLDLGVRNEAG